MDNWFSDYIDGILTLSPKEKALLGHGVSIIISDGLNLFFVLFISFLLKKLPIGLVYIISLSCLRCHSGGMACIDKTRMFSNLSIRFHNNMSFE
ncbi:MAG: accessory gene regulator B family protein [Erysipelotrichaceae bacterium]|nr:accessory gene regulator B family protein [Erysipelotrichaceae bacterium]